MATESVEEREPLSDPEFTEDESPALRRRRIIIFSVTMLLSLALIVLLMTQLLVPRADAPKDTKSLVGNVPTTLQGKPAPAFTLPTLNGDSKQLSLADFKGKAVVLNFWASNCEPCQAEAPMLQSAWMKLRQQSQNVMVLGIDIYDPEVKNANTFMSTYGMTYPNVRDEAGKTGPAYGITGQPETFFIDKDGNVVSRWRGQLDENGLRTELARLGVQY